MMVPQPSVAVILLRPGGLNKIHRDVATGANAPWYMTQTDELGNACGTIAVVHALANHAAELGMTTGALCDFMNAVKELDKDARGAAFDASEAIRTHHNQCAAEGQTSQPDNEEDVSAHFICFTTVNGELFELDGRMPGPISHGPCVDTLRGALAAIKTYFWDPNPVCVCMHVLPISTVCQLTLHACVCSCSGLRVFQYDVAWPAGRGRVKIRQRCGERMRRVNTASLVREASHLSSRALMW